MKKNISLLLSLLLFAFVFFVGSFSAFGASYIEATSVSLTGVNAKRPLSKVEIDNYFHIYNDYDDIDVDSDGVNDILLPLLERYNFSVKFSNGKTFVTNDISLVLGTEWYDGHLLSTFYEIDKNTFAEIIPYVSGKDYKNAVKNKSGHVYAKVKCSVYKGDLNDLYGNKGDELLNKPSSEKTFKIKFKLIDRYVTQIKAVSGVPKSVYIDADYVALKNAKFAVTYYTGTAKTFTVKYHSPVGKVAGDENVDIGYTLNGNPLYCEIGKNKLCFSYEDAPDFSISVKVNPCPYKKIEVKDCTLADDSTGYGKGLTSISCEITKTNGKKINVNKTFDQPSGYGVAAELDGYYLNYYTEAVGIIPEKFGGNTIIEVDFAGYEDTFNSSEASDATMLSKLMAKFETIVDKIMTVFFSFMF